MQTRFPKKEKMFKIKEKNQRVAIFTFTLRRCSRILATYFGTLLIFPQQETDLYLSTQSLYAFLLFSLPISHWIPTFIFDFYLSMVFYCYSVKSSFFSGFSLVLHLLWFSLFFFLMFLYVHYLLNGTYNHWLIFFTCFPWAFFFCHLFLLQKY